MVAEVIINRSAKKLNRTFDYNIPKNMQDFVIIGSKVLVPFGNSKKLEEAYVIGIKEKSNYEVKDIAKIEDNLTDFQIKLAKWMAKHYYCNVSDCIKLMLTPGTGRKENKIQDKTINVVYLKKEIEEIEFDIETKKLKSEKQIRVLNFVKDNEGCTIPELEAFTDTSRAIINTLIKNEYLELVEKTIERNPLENKELEKTQNLKLTQEQQNAYDKVERTIENNEFKEFLLYGVTGSGKTEVYLQLIKKVIEKEKTAIVLVPEISLTPQMLDRFISRFGKDEIAVLHSKLSIGERHDEWKKIKEGKIKIVIGARSAIFAPLENLGLVIIDEEHDSSYKSETTPKYNAKEIATILGKVNKCPVVLGSATPDLNTYYRATNNDKELETKSISRNEKIELLKLTKRANESSLPEVEVVDLKLELANGNRSMLSVDLYSAIEENIKNKLQTILFLNRRGYSTFIMCRECGYTVKCPNCNISLTYHRFGNILRCHYCGHEEKVVTTCPECGSDKIRYFGTGTQKLEQEINKQFPNASTIRMDVDTVTKKNSHEVILNKFKNENIDILIGTQMVVKGHHFPNVTLVGVITADSSLNIDDYRANERTFQILTQVAGRAGRENKKGKVIIQSYTPENYSIECSKKQDYELFYKTEIAIRKQLKYPPFCDIILIGFNSLNEKEIQQVSSKMYNYLKQELNEEEFKIFKPMPCPVDKIQNRFRWRIIIKGIVDENTNAILNKALRIVYNQNLKNTRVSIDVNPNLLYY